MSPAPLQDRVATLERQVAELTSRLNGGRCSSASETLDWPEPKPDWIAKVAGTITDVEGLEEVLRLGRERRASQPPAEDEDY